MLDKQTVQTFEKICRLILSIVATTFIFLFYKLYLFQNYIHTEAEEKFNLIKDFLTYGILFSVAYTIIDFLLHSQLEELAIKYFIDQSKYPTR